MTTKITSASPLIYLGNCKDSEQVANTISTKLVAGFVSGNSKAATEIIDWVCSCPHEISIDYIGDIVIELNVTFDDITFEDIVVPEPMIEEARKLRGKFKDLLLEGWVDKPKLANSFSIDALGALMELIYIDNAADCDGDMENLIRKVPEFKDDIINFVIEFSHKGDVPVPYDTINRLQIIT